MDVPIMVYLHGIKSTPHFLAASAVRTKQIVLSTAHEMSATQKLMLRDISQGISKNIGIVGRTYQKVWKA